MDEIDPTYNPWTDEDAINWLAEASFQRQNSNQNYQSRTPHRDLVERILARSPRALRAFATEPDEDLVIRAMTQDGYALHYVRNKTDAVVEAAIRQEPDAIRYVAQPTTAQQMLALTLNEPPGCANIDILIANLALFTDEALDQVRPGLALARQFYADASEDEQEEGFLAFFAAPADATCLSLPEDLTP